jgi:hypothetical protein
MTAITNSNYIQGTAYEYNTANQKGKTHNHTTRGEFNFTGDTYVCTNKKDVKKWLECAKRNGECEGLTFIPEKTTTFHLFLTLILEKFTISRTISTKDRPR